MATSRRYLFLYWRAFHKTCSMSMCSAFHFLPARYNQY
ncbi:unnamed protein product [Ixodes pacificus]